MLRVPFFLFTTRFLRTWIESLIGVSPVPESRPKKWLHMAILHAATPCQAPKSNRTDKQSNYQGSRAAKWATSIFHGGWPISQSQFQQFVSNKLPYASQARLIRQCPKCLIEFNQAAIWGCPELRTHQPFAPGGGGSDSSSSLPLLHFQVDYVDFLTVRRSAFYSAAVQVFARWCEGSFY